MNVHDFKAGGPNPILCNYQALDGEVCCLGKGEHAEQLAEVLRIRAEQDQVARGRLAFEAYDRDRGGVNYQGLPTPKWDDLTPGIRHGWVVGAAAVREQVLREFGVFGAEAGSVRGWGPMARIVEGDRTIGFDAIGPGVTRVSVPLEPLSHGTGGEGVGTAPLRKLGSRGGRVGGGPQPLPTSVPGPGRPQSEG